MALVTKRNHLGIEQGQTDNARFAQTIDRGFCPYIGENLHQLILTRDVSPNNSAMIGGEYIAASDLLP